MGIPISVEMPDQAVHRPTARPRASPSKVAARIASDPGTSIAPAIPCNARAPTRNSSVGAIAQSDGSQQNQTGRAGTFAITNARIYTVSGAVIENGTVVIQEGKIAAVGAGVSVPSGAERIDGKGLSVFPGMIDAGTNLGLAEIGQGANATVDMAEVGRDLPGLVSALLDRARVRGHDGRRSEHRPDSDRERRRDVVNELLVLAELVLACAAEGADYYDAQREMGAQRVDVGAHQRDARQDQRQVRRLPDVGRQPEADDHDDAGLPLEHPDGPKGVIGRGRLAEHLGVTPVR